MTRVWAPILGCLLGLLVSACGEPGNASPSAAEACVGVGDAVVRDVDWNPRASAVAALLSWSDGSMSVGRLVRGEELVVELVRSATIVPARVTIDDQGSVYWQSTESGRTLLNRQRANGAGEEWTAPGNGFSGLEATLPGLMATQVVAIGAEANDVDLVSVDLMNAGQVATRKEASTRGLQSVSVAPDRSTVASAIQTTIGGPITIAVSGKRSWQTTIGDILTPIAIWAEGGAVMARQASTSFAVLVDEAGAVRPSVLGTAEVLGFDVAGDGAVVSTSANITGGPGRICIVRGSK